MADFIDGVCRSTFTTKYMRLVWDELMPYDSGGVESYCW
jgi:hypothetical protein